MYSSTNLSIQLKIDFAGNPGVCEKFVPRSLPVQLRSHRLIFPSLPVEPRARTLNINNSAKAYHWLFRKTVYLPHRSRPWTDTGRYEHGRAPHRELKLSQSRWLPALLRPGSPMPLALECMYPSRDTTPVSYSRSRQHSRYRFSGAPLVFVLFCRWVTVCINSWIGIQTLLC